MKRISIAAVAAAFVIAPAFAGGSSDPSRPLVGIAKIVSHPALDAVEKGIMEEVAKTFPNARFDLQNANGEPSTASQIAQKFKVEKAAVAVGIATPTAQALAAAIKDVPVIYSAVTDPVAAGLVASFDKGGANVTGTSDLPPLEAQLDTLIVLAKARRVGHVYNAGEANSVKTAKATEAYLAKKGVQFVPAVVANSAEVGQAIAALAGRVDGIYLSTDNTVFSAISTVADLCLKQKLPLVTADPSSAEKVPVLAAVGFDYYKMGLATGRIVAAVLKGKKTADIPTYFARDLSEHAFVVNLNVARELGIAVPADMLSRASLVIGSK